MATNRRTFVIQSVLGACVITASGLVQAQTVLKDQDPTALALGYKTDGTKTDTKKYPKYAAGQMCSNCALYQGKPADSAGVCPLFTGKQVSGKGWCSAYAKKG